MSDPRPYELLVRWDPATGVLRGAHVQWSTGRVQPIREAAAGGYPLADILPAVTADALAAHDTAQAALAAAQADLQAAQQAQTEAEAARDAAQAERDQLAAQLAALQQQPGGAVEAHKFLLELESRGLLDDIEAFVGQQSRGVQLAFARAPSYSPDSVMMRAAQAQLGMPDALYEEIFAAARARVT